MGKQKTFKTLNEFKSALNKNPEQIQELVKKCNEIMENRKHLGNEWGNFEGLSGLSEAQIKEKAQDMVKQMSLEQKIRQMSGDNLIEDRFLFFTTIGDLNSTLFLEDTLDTPLYNEPFYGGEDLELGIPGIKFTDGPIGVVVGDGNTCFPVTMGRSSTWDPELEEQVGDIMGVEARAQGANLISSVSLTLTRHPAWGRAQDSYGEDTFLISKMGTALTRGIQNHIMACGKVFCLNSMEFPRFRVNISIDERSLREIYLPQFKACVDEGIACFMTSYNKVRGKKTAENKYLVTDVLRNDWGFNGYLISDFIYGVQDGKAAVLAGMDIEMPYDQFMGEDLERMVKEGEIDEKYIDEAVTRIISTKIKFSQVGDKKRYTKENIGIREHTEVAGRMAREAIVLLENKNSLLPLNFEGTKDIAVLGNLADFKNRGDVAGAARVCPKNFVSPLKGIKNKVGQKIKILHSNAKDLDEAAEMAAKADKVIIVAGLTYKDEGEFVSNGQRGDRKSLELHKEDLDLIDKVASVRKDAIVCLEGGSAILVEPWRKDVGAILMLWYPGMEGGNALADILFGDCNPSGKLPITVPASVDQLPEFNTEADEVTYDYYHGYFLADKNNYKVSYPFGYGLSYTEYKYENLRISKDIIKKDEELEVTIEVKNVGKRAGDEIVQMYVGYVNSKAMRHVKDLKGFGRLHLEPGETKEMKLKLKAENLAYYDPDLCRWIVEEIEYLIHVGASSRESDLITSSIRVV